MSKLFRIVLLFLFIPFGAESRADVSAVETTLASIANLETSVVGTWNGTMSATEFCGQAPISWTSQLTLYLQQSGNVVKGNFVVSTVPQYEENCQSSGTVTLILPFSGSMSGNTLTGTLIAPDENAQISGSVNGSSMSITATGDQFSATAPMTRTSSETPSSAASGSYTGTYTVTENITECANLQSLTYSGPVTGTFLQSGPTLTASLALSDAKQWDLHDSNHCTVEDVEEDILVKISAMVSGNALDGLFLIDDQGFPVSGSISGTTINGSVQPPNGSASFTVTRSGMTLPTIQQFTATPSEIRAGNASTLTWSTLNATSVSIDQGVGTKPASGSVTVQPSVTTTYRLTAMGPGGTAQATTTIHVSPAAGCIPQISAPGSVQSGIRYLVTWTEVDQPGATYEIQESTTPDFSTNVTTRIVAGLSTDFQHVVTEPTAYYYRVRAVSCQGSPGTFSGIARTIVVPPAPPESTKFELVAPLGTTSLLTQQIFIASPGGTTTFTITVDQPWITVSPSSGTIGPSGVTVTVTANPGDLPVGSTTASLTIVFGAGKTALNGGSKSIPVSVTLVTPVTPGGKDAPAENSIIIPAVAHVAGGAFFQSDVRLANRTNSSLDYTLFFTPTLSDGTRDGRRTTIRLSPGQTAALNDIVKHFFGYAAPGDFASGSMEIRPLGTLVRQTFASSRTYATTPLGTLGQFIPGIPFVQLLGNPVPSEQPPTPENSTISLQQVAHNTEFRTNLGLVEASGAGASGRVRVLSASNVLLREESFTLGPAEHRQINGYLGSLGAPVSDARLEVVVDSPRGRVTAYASVIDNLTNDPFFVAPARPSQVRSRRFILPGVAAVETSFSNFYTDVRIYNGGTTPFEGTLRYMPFSGLSGQGSTVQVSIPPGHVQAWNNILPSLFGIPFSAGALHLESDSEASLVVTGRTFSRAAAGSYGQFIPALVPTDGAGLGERPLELLQLEQSPEFRTNVGLIELTGKPVTIRMTVSVPGSLTSPIFETTLQGYEFRQYNAFLQTPMNLGNVYNGRIAIQVLGGEGRIGAYASVIDGRTNDPTYVPAQ